MRLRLILAAALAAACTDQQGPLPANYPVPQPSAAPASRPAPRAGGDPAQQDSQRVQRALDRDSLDQRINAADGADPRATGEPGYAPFDEGADGQLPVIPSSVSPVFR